MRRNSLLALALASGFSLALFQGQAIGAVPSPGAATPRDMFYNEDLTGFQWWAESVGAPTAHAASVTGEGVVVAVLDTGVDGTHPDLAGQILPGADTLDVDYGGEIVELDPTENNDVHGHGTHVAGIIAAKDDGKGITGIAPDAKILPVRVLSEMGGSFETIAAGIDWAVANNADIINMSLGGGTRLIELGPDSDPLCEAIGRADEAGVLVVVAAGNDGGYGNPLSTPAGCPGSFSVSSINSRGVASYFTSYDPSVAVAGPGEEVFSTFPAESELPGGYVPLSGTSMATPAVAGVAALVVSQDPSRTGEDVKTILKESATDLGRPGKDALYGDGLVSAPKALGLSSSPEAWLPRPHTVGIYNAADPETGDTLSDEYIVVWSLPGSEEVASYVVREFPTGALLAEVDGNQVRARVAPSDPYILSFYVEATLADGTVLRGEPYYIDLSPSGPTPFEDATTAKGKWVKEGLAISVVRKGAAAETGAAVEVEVRGSFDPYNGTDFTRTVKVPAGKNKVVMKVDKASLVRSDMLTLEAHSGDEVAYWDLSVVEPQWLVKVGRVKVNSSQVMLYGGVWSCPSSESSAGLGDISECEGHTISVVDKSGRTIARGAVKPLNMESYVSQLQYDIMMTNPPKVVSVVLGSYQTPFFRIR